MRTRSTWQGNGAATPRQAATHRQADIYKMNQEHPDPKPTDYESGDPDSWAESWHGYGDVEAEYEGGHVKRNELNFGEFRDNTFKHKDSDNWHSGKGTYDNVKDGEGKFSGNTSGKSQGEKAGRSYEAAGGKPATASDARDMAERKAQAVERITRAMLRTSNVKLVEDIAIGLMGMPDRVVVSTLRALDAVSPDALSPDNKRRRAMACTKLAARMIGEEATDKQLEQLASTFMTIDDPTLKSILKQLAASRVAQDEEGQDEGSKSQEHQGQQQVTGQQQDQAQQQQMSQEQQQAQQQQMSQEQQAQQEAQQRFMQQQQVPQVGQQQQQGQQDQQVPQVGQQQQQGQEDEEAQMGIPHMSHGLPAGDLQMLDQMLKEEMAEQGVPGGDDLQSLFEAAPAPAAPVAPVMASQVGGPEISFDDEDEVAAPPVAAAPQVAATGDSELDALFGDNEEVQAQRAIKAAEQEQVAREGGFAVGRTASSKGVKKIGQVQRGKSASVDQTLENLWDRP